MTGQRQPTGRHLALLLLLAACSGDHTGPGPEATLDADPGTRVATMDAATPPDATTATDADTGRAMEASTPCTPGEEVRGACPEVEAICNVAGGIAVARCQPDQSLGGCECVYEPGALTPPSAEETAACLDVAEELFVDACAGCICGDSQECAQAVTHCDAPCRAILQCLVPCLPDAGAADIDCITKCFTAFSPDAVATFGASVPGCAARCPDVCITGLRAPAVPPGGDADAG